MSKPGELYHLRLKNPARVDRRGHDYGGMLKLHHRTDVDNAHPVVGEIIVVKWPSYSQWSGVGHRESNTVEYWMLRVVALPEEEKGERYTTCSFIKGIEPGRKRSLVKALIAEADALYGSDASETVQLARKIIAIDEMIMDNRNSRTRVKSLEISLRSMSVKLAQLLLSTEEK